VERFTSRRMAEDYLRIYAKLVDVAPAHPNLNAMRTRRARRPFRGLHAAANIREVTSIADTRGT